MMLQSHAPVGCPEAHLKITYPPKKAPDRDIIAWTNPELGEIHVIFVVCWLDECQLEVFRKNLRKPSTFDRIEKGKGHFLGKISHNDVSKAIGNGSLAPYLEPKTTSIPNQEKQKAA